MKKAFDIWASAGGFNHTPEEVEWAEQFPNAKEKTIFFGLSAVLSLILFGVIIYLAASDSSPMNTLLSGVMAVLGSGLIATILHEYSLQANRARMILICYDRFRVDLEDLFSALFPHNERSLRSTDFQKIKDRYFTVVREKLTVYGKYIFQLCTTETTTGLNLLKGPNTSDFSKLVELGKKFRLAPTDVFGAVDEAVRVLLYKQAHSD